MYKLDRNFFFAKNLNYLLYGKLKKNLQGKIRNYNYIYIIMKTIYSKLTYAYNVII